ncbi:MAG TPA: hypothetical protein VFN10_06945 [Thermoanaerobaculia bacterium]|nr:hypothetical protein [Thermoanaerobaculia bacterium]
MEGGVAVTPLHEEIPAVIPPFVSDAAANTGHPAAVVRLTDRLVDFVVAAEQLRTCFVDSFESEDGSALHSQIAALYDDAADLIHRLTS